MASQPELSTKQIDELCDRFEAAWRSGEAPRLEEFLANLCETDREQMLRELLFIDHEYRCRRGDPPGDAEYRGRFPEHTQLIEEVLAAGAGHRANSQFATGHAHNTATAQTLDGKPTPPANSSTHDSLLDAVLVASGDPTAGPTLGDYHLLEEVGRGGMGIVFRARQKSVSRIVAVKLLRRDKLKELSPDSRDTMIERFRTEAQSAAQLQHDHIVPVYEVGEENGLYYYSMRFVAGDSLGDLIKDHPLDNRTAAELIEPIARALDEAHKSGVLHRDIKPRNVIVERKTKRPLLTDFGLAKLVESNQEMTRTGDVMGSPPYMSPEQATDAASVTRAADVYSLGATLYHILTGRAPFQAANVAETLRQVLFDEPIPLRQLNPAIDVDLETIALKCLEKEPTRRFATAGELADELRRYLRNEPIRSRPIGATGRFVRVCRRNPVVSTLGFAIAALLIALPIVFAIGYYNEAASRQQAEENLQLAQDRLDLAADAVDEFTGIATGDEVGQDFETLRRHVLEASRKYYDRIVQQEGSGERMHAQLGKAYGRLADIEAHASRHSDAVKLYERAIAVFDELYQKTPSDSDYARLQATYQTSLAAALRDLGHREAARETLDAAHDTVHALAEREPDAIDNLKLLAQIHDEQAVLATDRGERGEAEKARLEAVGNWRTIIAKQPGDENSQMLAQSLHDLAFHLQQEGRDKEAIAHFTAAHDLWENLYSNDLKQYNRERPEYVAGKARCQAHLGVVRLRQGDVEQAGEMIWSGLRLRQNLVDSSPHVPDYKDELAQSHDVLGQFFQRVGKFDEAAAEYRQAQLLREDLRNKLPDVPKYDVAHAASHISLGALQMEQRQFPAAADNFRTALEILIRITSQHPEVVAYRQHMAGAHHNLATALHAGGQLREALPEAQAAAGERQRIALSTGDSNADRDALAASLEELASIYEDQGDHEKAAQNYAAALGLRKKLTATQGAPLEFSLRAAALGVRYAALLASREDYDASILQFTAAIDSLDACRSSDPQSPALTQMLQITLAARAQVFNQQGEFAKAAADWGELLQLADEAQRPSVTLRQALSLAREGQHAQAVSLAESAWSQAMSPDPPLVVQALAVYSRAIEAAEADAVPTADERQQTIDKYVATAVKVLRGSIGEKQVLPAEVLRAEEDLARLLREPQVSELLKMLPDAPVDDDADEEDTVPSGAPVS